MVFLAFNFNKNQFVLVVSRTILLQSLCYVFRVKIMMNKLFGSKAWMKSQEKEEKSRI